MTIPTDAEPGTILYRAAAYYYGSSAHVSIYYVEYVVRKVTPMGAWVMLKGDSDMVDFWEKYYGRDPKADPGHKPTWYPFTCKFVSATKEEALEGLRIRKIRHRMHLQRRLLTVERILKHLDVKVEHPLVAQLDLWEG